MKIQFCHQHLRVIAEFEGAFGSQVEWRSEIRKPNHLKSRQKLLDFERLGLQLNPDHLKSDLQKVKISNVSGF